MMAERAAYYEIKYEREKAEAEGGQKKPLLPHTLIG